MNRAKFCAGCTLGHRNVESIDRMPKSATTGTPAALAAKLVGDDGDGFGFWMAFAVVAIAFGVAWI